MLASLAACQQEYDLRKAQGHQALSATATSVAAISMDIRKLLAVDADKRAQEGYEPKHVPEVFEANERTQITKSFHSAMRVKSLKKARTGTLDEEDFFSLAQQQSEFGQPTMNFSEFKEHARKAPTCSRKYFDSATFLKFPRDKSGCINCEDFLRYVRRSIDVETTALQLLAHARELTNGYMTEQELERYIFELIPEMRGCQRLHESFYPFYVFTASRRFFFFLDPQRTATMSIKKLAHRYTTQKSKPSTCFGMFIYVHGQSH
jgi:hypothetical protein